MILTMLQNKGMSKGVFLIVAFKKDFIPFDLTEFHVTLGRRDVIAMYID